MNPRQNIGIINAMIRITCGLATLAMVTAKMVRRPDSLLYTLAALMAAMKVAEGIVRFCPLTAAITTGRDMYDEMADGIIDDNSFNGFGQQDSNHDQES